jgi:hypothetical protein
MALQGYFNRFDAAKRYDELLFRASRGLQSAELNEIQAVLSDRMKRISDVLFRDGGVVRGASATIDPQTGEAQLDAGAIYVLGAVREVAARTITVPTTGSAEIGVRVVTSTITELEDADLRDPAVGTRNFQEAGAGRTRRLVTWGWRGDGEPGDFFSVYRVLNGALVTQSAPPVADNVRQLIARYDRDANGNYAVRGLQTISEGQQGNAYGFTITDGVANVLGFKVDKPSAMRELYDIDPDLETVNNEPKVSNTIGTQTLTTNRKPLNSVNDVVITAEKTVNIIRGSFSGGLDPLPDPSVLSIQSVTQDATTFVSGTDYVLTADQVDWSLPGNEPAPGSTYAVTYRYITSVTPSNINPDEGTFQISGAVEGTLVLVAYTWKMPRYDILALDSLGLINRIKGVPSRFTPAEPISFVPGDQLALSSIFYNWRSDHTPEVREIGTRVTSMEDLRRMKESIDGIYDLIAIERLNNSISSREPTAKFGVFVDPFNNNDLRDAGVTQSAVVVGNELRPRVVATEVLANSVVTDPLTGDESDPPRTLPFTEEVVLEQALRTQTLTINPRLAFQQVTTNLQLSPRFDTRTTLRRFTDTSATAVLIDDSWVTFRFDPFWYNFTSRLVTGNIVLTQPITLFDRLISFMRPRNVSFRLTARGSFKPGEQVSEVFFAGRPVTPNTLRTADSLGRIRQFTSFPIPNDVPAGTVIVKVVGGQGSVAAAYYTGHPNARNIWQTLRTAQTVGLTVVRPETGVKPVGPVAQTFTLTEDRQVTSIDLKFAAKGTTGAPVAVKIVQTENGTPNNQVLASALIDSDSILINNTYVNAAFDLPVHLRAGQEFAIVVESDDPGHSLAVAELGRFDSFANTFVASQPFTVGRLLTSVNAESWTGQDAVDLTFRLNGAVYTSSTSIVPLGSFTVSSMSDLAATASYYLPSEATSIRFRYTRTTGEVFELEPDIPINFQTAISDTLQVQAVLSGSSKLAPVLFPGVESAVGTFATTGDYQSRTFTLNSSGSTLRVVFEARLSGSAAVTPLFRNSSGTFQGMTLASANPVGDGWVEFTYNAAAAGLTTTAIRLELAGNPQFRPRVRALRAVYV